jgi:hypothetical protein
MDHDTAIAAAQRALMEEFVGEPSISESVGVIAAQMVVNGGLLKRILAELQAINATEQGGK